MCVRPLACDVLYQGNAPTCGAVRKHEWPGGCWVSFSTNCILPSTWTMRLSDLMPKGLGNASTLLQILQTLADLQFWRTYVHVGTAFQSVDHEHWVLTLPSFITKQITLPPLYVQHALSGLPPNSIEFDFDLELITSLSLVQLVWLPVSRLQQFALVQAVLSASLSASWGSYSSLHWFR